MLYGLSPLLGELISRRVVYVLGAGASKDCGLPLYRELLDRDYLKEIRAFLDGLRITASRRKDFEALIESAERRMLAFEQYGIDVEQLLEKFSVENHKLYDQLVDPGPREVQRHLVVIGPRRWTSGR
jgi:NAD-dependent SIR2 family protein deacetylase